MRFTSRETLSYLAIIMVCLLVLFIGACSSENGTHQPTDDLLIRLAPIHEVDIRIAESYPPQVFVYIKGGLSDGCTTFHEMKVEKAGNTIDIEVTTKRPKDAACDTVYGYFEKNTNLGSDFISGETYYVNVNDFSTSFKMQ